jgi:GT2 family glycosyltransferase
MEDLYFGTLQDVYEVKDVMAAHWLISMDCLRRTGGFSPTFRHYGEDNNYVDRVEYHGFKTGFVPATKAVHDRENRSDSLGDPTRRINIITLVELSDITRPKPWFRLIFRYLQYIYKYRTLKHFKSMFQCIRDLRTILENRRESTKTGAFLNL